MKKRSETAQRHKATLTYNQEQKTNKRKRMRRDLIFFNPPFNRDVKTDIGKQFLKLIDKNFPSNNPISEVINRAKQWSSCPIAAQTIWRK